MSSRGGTTLYVTGFSHGTRARDLAYEFERLGSVPSDQIPPVVVVVVVPPSSPPSPIRPLTSLMNLHPQSFLALLLRRLSIRSLREALYVLVDHYTCAACKCILIMTSDLEDRIRLISFLTAGTVSDFAFVEYEDRRDADDAYYEMHNKRLGRDDILKIEWARTPPSASWRFESGRDRDRRGGGSEGGREGGRDAARESVRESGRDSGRRSPRRGRSPSPRRGARDYSPRKDDRRDRDRDYDRDGRRDRDRSHSPETRERDRDVKEDRDDRDRRENGTSGDDRKGDDSPPPAARDEDLDIAE
ncbi:hypothetical protein E4U30_000083 [Claviceps sp. LM220 group G6]|nr:hypothetical protein E4U15_004625 [Claviceps sp. LM218 group G6]KAG6102075.1 hypothetical protein E4U30_000083 [Claviceps sp. LM220 group G6]KAG6110860.1 hypothetical protein E4U31_005167 [Claviceps sp. LM219 group G6]